jgi:hypothetical protein
MREMSGKRIKRRMNDETRGRTDIAIDRASKGGVPERGGKWTWSPKDGAMSYQNVYSSTRPSFEGERIEVGKKSTR